MQKAIKVHISAIKNLPNMVAVAINIHKLLKLKKLGFLAQPNLLYNEESLLTLKYPHRLDLARPGESAIAHSSR